MAVVPVSAVLALAEVFGLAALLWALPQFVRERRRQKELHSQERSRRGAVLLGLLLGSTGLILGPFVFAILFYHTTG